jgi:hypothetical protein
MEFQLLGTKSFLCGRSAAFLTSKPEIMPAGWFLSMRFRPRISAIPSFFPSEPSLALFQFTAFPLLHYLYLVHCMFLAPFAVGSACLRHLHQITFHLLVLSLLKGLLLSCPKAPLRLSCKVPEFLVLAHRIEEGLSRSLPFEQQYLSGVEILGHPF